MGKLSNMEPQKKIQRLWWVATVIGLLGLMFFTLQLLVPYEIQKGILDRIAADGELESFTDRIYHQLRWISIIAGIFCLLVSVYLIIFRENSKANINKILTWIEDFSKRVGSDLVSFFRGMMPGKEDLLPLLLLLGILLLGVFFRYVYLWRPMGHDEAYTFMAFASRSLRIVLTDYHLPNNHVFHTILVHLFYRLLGDSPAVIRLPAFAAGVLMIPATYFTARTFYGWKIGLGAASIVASLPIMIDYSTNARGYTTIALFALLIIMLAVYIKDNKNLFGWFLLIVFSSLGMYTNPTMLYPMGMAFTWLLLSFWIGDVSAAYGKRFVLYLLVAGVSIGLVTGILYLPIVFSSGLESLIGNRMVETLSWSHFSQSIYPRIRNTWQEWHRSLPPALSFFALLGLAALFFVPRSPNNRRIPLILAGFLWIAVTLLVQRVAPWPRIWFFLAPFFVIWITAGWFGLVSLLINRLPNTETWSSLLVGIFVLIPISAGLLSSIPQYTLKLSAQGEIEQIADILQHAIQPGDAVVATSPDRVILDYYLMRKGLGRNLSDLGNRRDIQRSIVVVDTAYGQTLESVLAARAYLDDVDMDTMQEIYRSRRIILYQLLNSTPSSGAVESELPRLLSLFHQ